MQLIGLLFFLCGLVFGSFGNVLIYRLPLGQSIKGRSRCLRCGKTIRAIDLIPVISFVLLRGRCRSCKEKLGWQYPAVELGSGFLALLAFIIAPSLFLAVILAFALWLLLLISMVDARIQGIPDSFNIPFIILAFIYMALVKTFDPYAFIIGVGFFGAQWLISRGKWIGNGDVLLAVGLSALLGTRELVLFMLITSYILGALMASAFLLIGKMTRRDHIAFGPFLALGTLLSLLVGDMVMSCLLWSGNACSSIPFS